MKMIQVGVEYGNFVGEASASISEQSSIASGSSFVGTVIGSFLKINVIMSLGHINSIVKNAFTNNSHIIT